MTQKLRAALRRIRGAEALNGPVTAAMRAAFGGPAWAVEHLPRSGLVRTGLPNGSEMRLWSRGDDWVANQVFWRGWDGYEPEMSSRFYRRALSARVVVDVGAHVGYYSLLASLANPSATVYAIEPEPKALGRLRRNISLNRVPELRVIEAAAGERAGEARFFIPDVDGIQSAASLELFSASVPSIPVRVVAIDDLALDGVDLVKIDVEGAAHRVVDGMRRTIERCRPAIFIELIPGDRTRELPGYVGYWLTGDEMVREETPTLSHTWRNHLFLPADPSS